MDYTYLQIAKMIDHSLLNQLLTDQELEAGCRLARDYDVASACIKPYFLKRCAEMLAGSSVAASTVIGFPHGGNTDRDQAGGSGTGAPRRRHGAGHGREHRQGAQRGLGLCPARTSR